MSDETQKWHDVLTEDELVAALRLHAAQLAKRHGYYEISAEIGYAADCIEDLCEIRDKLVDQIAQMAGAGLVVAEGIENVRREIRSSIESLSKAAPL